MLQLIWKIEIDYFFCLTTLVHLFIFPIFLLKRVFRVLCLIHEISVVICIILFVYSLHHLGVKIFVFLVNIMWVINRIGLGRFCVSTLKFDMVSELRLSIRYLPLA
ncbi:hypothetical protein HanPI659440_Chr10g0394821 [Helianthus annuus]|nr:hypothetical protein HanPI659440_Chr10g0394821 [Helianthus annuus]